MPKCENTVMNMEPFTGDNGDIMKSEMKCFICTQEFKSTYTSKKNDKKFHIKKKKENQLRFKCGQCGATFIDKIEVLHHIIRKHKACNVCNHSSITQVFRIP